MYPEWMMYEGRQSVKSNVGGKRPGSHGGQRMDEGTQFASVLARIGRDVLKQLEGLSDELLNRPLALPETNTLFALATHIAGSTEFLALEMAAGRRVDPIRQAELPSVLRRQDLIDLYQRLL